MCSDMLVFLTVHLLLSPPFFQAHPNNYSLSEAVVDCAYTYVSVKARIQQLHVLKEAADARAEGGGGDDVGMDVDSTFPMVNQLELNMLEEMVKFLEGVIEPLCKWRQK